MEKNKSSEESLDVFIRIVVYKDQIIYYLNQAKEIEDGQMMMSLKRN